MQRPLAKSKYTSIPKLDALISPPSKSAKILPKITPAGSAKVFAVEDFDQKKLAEVLSREEAPKDQYEAYINSHYNCGFVVVIGKAADGKKIKIETNLPHGACVKSVIIIEDGADVAIHENLSGSGKALFAQTTYIGGGAKLAVVRTGGADEEQIMCRQFIAMQDSTLESSTAFTGGKFSRSSTTNIIEGKGASIKDYMFLITRKTQHSDINYSSVHRATDGFSHCVFKSALRDESRSIFDGMIKIEHSADKSNALLECHAMMLGNKASSNQIPSLEIKTDDVKATHSATVARIEDDEIFYLESRGIANEEAKKIIIKSFLESIVYMLPETIRGPLEEKIGENA